MPILCTFLDYRRRVGGIGPADPEHEVTRQVDARHRESQSFGQGPVEDRETDRDPQLAIDHLVDITIARVVIVVDVPLVPLLHEEHPVDLPQDLPGLGARRAAVAG